VKELIPLCAGLTVGASLALVGSPRLRAVLLPVLALVVGVLTSAINGELATEGWAVFVSFDALVVWLGAATGFALVRLRRTRAETS
jgi:hypothetical protein